MQSALSISVQTYSTLSELGAQTNGESADLVVLSLLEASREACASALKDLPEFASGHPVIALASANDPGLAFAAIHCGAKGFIPVTMGFEIAIEVMRFILAGGTYVPPDCLLASDQLGLPAPTTPSRLNILTGRELSVVQAIQLGKSNKIIAHELNMGLSTVKVHLRNVMRKMNAKNRTDVAMKAGALRVLTPHLVGGAGPWIQHKAASDAVLVAPTARERPSQLGPRRCVGPQARPLCAVVRAAVASPASRTASGRASSGSLS
jgi:DNA-binding NarL/FixJ family response regulator